MLHTAKQRITQLTRGFKDAVLASIAPPHCLMCREPVTHHPAVCATCFGKLNFIGRPRCGHCGVPLGPGANDGSECGACLAEPPAFDAAMAACLYDEASQGLVTRLKYADSVHLAPLLAEWMLRHGQDMLAGADMLVPVPLHPSRLRQRMFNQSALLGEIIARKSGVSMHQEVLLRTRATAPQAGLSRNARKKNVSGAFSVGKMPLSGQCVLLIDDVMTTGATLHACAKALRKAGAREVRVLVFARRVEEATA
ncbi:ComF family protein [bacterium]|nr:ComF family protein [bacterium]